MTRRINRRTFIEGTGAAGIGLWVAGPAVAPAPPVQRWRWFSMAS